MKNWLLIGILYWYGTTNIMQQYQWAKILSGEHKGEIVNINYTWDNGNVDVLTGDCAFNKQNISCQHYFIEDYRNLEQVVK